MWFGLLAAVLLTLSGCGGKDSAVELTDCEVAKDILAECGGNDLNDPTCDLNGDPIADDFWECMARELAEQEDACAAKSDVTNTCTIAASR